MSDAIGAVEPGDWVAFYRDGVIVYGKVEYLGTEVGGYVFVCTTCGRVREDAVLERRGPVDADA